MTEEKKENKVLNKSFWTGAVLGVLVLCTIGFVVLLVVVLSEGGDNLAKDKPSIVSPPTNQVVNNLEAPTKDIILAEITKDDPMKGDFKAPITIIEFSDTECPFCKR